jgi:hypothetical protein
MEDRLFFILRYLKEYPLQESIALNFGISQATANKEIHFLSHVLYETLKYIGHSAQRTAENLLHKLELENFQIHIIDATERRINRPKDVEGQKQFYSGKKKCHTVKNIIIVGENDRQIKYLGLTHEGKKHDKQIASDEALNLPKNSALMQDSGFQGYSIKNSETIQPKKKPKGKELTDEEKSVNRVISGFRVFVEHVISGVKRCRVVKDTFRNTKENFDDVVIDIACALHNFRSYHRRHTY